MSELLTTAIVDVTEPALIVSSASPVTVNSVTDAASDRFTVPDGMNTNAPSGGGLTGIGPMGNGGSCSQHNDTADANQSPAVHMGFQVEMTTV